jgi:hypothetical protein
MPRRPPDLERLRDLNGPAAPSAIRSLGSFSSSAASNIAENVGFRLQWSAVSQRAVLMGIVQIRDGSTIGALLGAKDDVVLRWFILAVALLLDPAAVLLLCAATRRD